VRLHEKALEAAKRAVRINPKSPVAIRALGKTLSASGENMKAFSALQKLTALQPHKITNWLELASTAAAVPNIPATRSAIAQALYRGRRSTKVIKACVGVLLQIGELRDSLSLLEFSLKLEPSDTITWEKYANLNLSQGNYEKASAAWEEIAVRAQDDPVLLERCGKALWDLGRVETAKDIWKKARDVDPKNPHIVKSLADVYMHLGEIQKGLGLLTEAAKWDTDNVDLMKNAVNASLEYGDALQAGDLLSTLDRDGLSDPAIHLLLLETYAEMGDWERTLEELERVETSSSTSLGIKSIALHGIGEYERSWDAYQAATTFEIKSDREALICASAASSLGDYKQAERYLGQVRNQTNPRVRLIQILLAMRIMDASWIYQDLKVPTPLLATYDLDETDIQSMLEDLRAAGHPNLSLEDMEAFESRMRVAFGEIDPNLDPIDAYSASSDAEGLDTLVIGWIKAGQAESAVGRIEEVAHNSIWKGLLHARCLEVLGRFEDALKAIEASQFPQNLHPLVDFLKARILLALDDIPGATAVLNQAILAWPDTPAWHALLASIYQDQADPEKALPHLQKAVELDPDSGDQQLSLARAFSDCGQWTESVEAFKNAIPQYPESGKLYKEAAQTALSAGDFSLSFDWFERACTLSPSDPHALIGAAQSALMEGKKREAKEYATSALRLAPEDPEVLKGFGDLLAGQGKFDTALEAYDRALLQTPDSKPLIRSRSKILMEIDRSQEALEELQKMAELEPSDHESWYSLATAAEKAGNLEEADAAATQAIRLSPINPEYHLTLGRICRARGQLDRALDELSHAKSLADTESRISLEIGKVCEERQELDRALDAYQSVISHDPNSFEAFFRSGLILRSKKNYPQAGGMLKRAVEINPLDRNALHQLAAVRALELIHGRVAASRIST
jgi:tetratricopeptide (TPR) repeat protein